MNCIQLCAIESQLMSSNYKERIIRRGECVNRYLCYALRENSLP